MIVKKYQKYCSNRLIYVYPEVVVEWNPFKGCNVNEHQYCPRPDIAVGPFAKSDKQGINYDTLLSEPKSKKFIDLLIRANNLNIEKFNEKNESNLTDFYHFNHNSRCFICIEIENKVSKKHIVGGLVNASALGRIAVLIAWTPGILKSFIKLKNYLKYLSNVEKNSFKTDNVLILDKNQFKSILDSILRSR